MKIRNILKRIDENLIIIVTFIAICYFFLLFFFSFNNNISGFYRIGYDFNKSPYLDTTKIIQYNDNGYDGQQFLTLAFDPLLLNPNTIEALDDPIYRARRIAFPLMGYITGLGNPNYIIYTLVVVNFLGFILLIYYVSEFFIILKKPKIYALLILMLPPIWIILSLNTSEILCSAFSIGSIVYYLKNKNILSVIFITIAILTRETALLLLFILIVSSISNKKYRLALLLTIPVFIFSLWSLYLYNHIYISDFNYDIKQLSYPFQGLYNKTYNFFVSANFSFNFISNYISFFFIFILICNSFIIAIKKIKLFQSISLLFFGQTLLFIMFTNEIFDDLINLLRVNYEITLLSYIFIPWSKRNSFNISIISLGLIISLGYIGMQII